MSDRVKIVESISAMYLFNHDRKEILKYKLNNNEKTLLQLHRNRNVFSIFDSIIRIEK